MDNKPLLINCQKNAKNMIDFLTKEDFRNYIQLPRNFDVELLYAFQETCFRTKIFPLFSEELLQQWCVSEAPQEQALYQLIAKAAAGYTFLLAIPRLKLHLNNFGIDQVQQEKSKTAPWWDIRDYGLSLVKTSDQALSNAIDLAMKNSIIKAKVKFFETYAGQHIKTPAAFNSIYNINHSVDVYQLMVPIMQRCWLLKIAPLLGPCATTELEAYPEVYDFLKQSLVYFSLYEASNLGHFCFLTSSVVVQYDELPWQKSLILSPQERYATAQNMQKLAGELILAALLLVKNNPEKLPCFKTAKAPSGSSAIAKKSGLYL
jgi:hypothetical protein